VPKKLLVYGAMFNEEFNDAIGFGWMAQRPPHDWKCESHPAATATAPAAPAPAPIAAGPRLEQLDRQLLDSCLSSSRQGVPVAPGTASGVAAVPRSAGGVSIE
jgi:hypothetical protein